MSALTSAFGKKRLAVLALSISAHRPKADVPKCAPPHVRGVHQAFMCRYLACDVGRRSNNPPSPGSLTMNECEAISRRNALSLGLAALFSLAATPILLTVSEAEAQQPATPPATAPTPGTTPPTDTTPGTERRLERRRRRRARRAARRDRRRARRTARRDRRQARRAARRDRRQDRREGRRERRDDRREGRGERREERRN
jgi:hypothetical protein